MYTATTCKYLLLTNWKLLCSLIGDAYMLRYRADDMILKYPKTYVIYFSLVYICIYKVSCLIICIYVCTYLPRYIYACTYMTIFNGDGLWARYDIIDNLLLHNITSECRYHIMCHYFLMLNSECSVSYFAIVPCMLILPEIWFMYHYYHMLCQQRRNKDVQSINQSINIWFSS